MSKYITHRMTLLSLSYCDWYQQVCSKIGITDEKVLEKLHPKYKEKDKNGTEVGKDRCDRFMIWANHRSVMEEDHYDRLRVLEDYIRMIYPRLVKEVQKEEDLFKFFHDGVKKFVTDAGVPLELFERKASSSNRKKKRKEDPNQLTFNFGDENERS